jgi:hypothetical protein
MGQMRDKRLDARTLLAKEEISMWQFEADVDNGKPNLAVAQDGIGDPIFELDNLGSSTKHNGGHIHFGADGEPYIPVGDNKGVSLIELVLR